jgi:hypothetical protein
VGLPINRALALHKLPPEEDRFGKGVRKDHLSETDYEGGRRAKKK